MHGRLVAANMLVVALLTASAVGQIASVSSTDTVQSLAAGVAWDELPHFVGARMAHGVDGGVDAQAALAIGPGPAIPGNNATILSTGRASAAVGVVPPSRDHGASVRGAFDPVVVELDLSVPKGHDCVWIPFRLLTTQNPLGPADRFLAELDADTWSATNDAGFALDNGTALTTASPLLTVHEAAGTPFSRATPALVARSPVQPGPHVVRLIVFDGGDGASDSAVYLDNMTSHYAAHAFTPSGPRPASGPTCAPGIVQPESIGFTWSPAAKACETVVFTPDAVPKGSLLAWDFRDGNTSMAQKPAFRFGSDGTFNVTLMATEPDGTVRIGVRPVDVAPGCDMEALPGGPYKVPLGGPQKVFGTWRGGIGPHTCTWRSLDGLGATVDGCALLLEPTAVGPHEIELEVRDAAGNSAVNRTKVDVQDGAPGATSGRNRPDAARDSGPSADEKAAQPESVDPEPEEEDIVDPAAERGDHENRPDVVVPDAGTPEGIPFGAPDRVEREPVHAVPVVASQSFPWTGFLVFGATALVLTVVLALLLARRSK